MGVDRTKADSQRAATVTTRSNAFIFESVRLPEDRRTTTRAKQAATPTSSVRSTPSKSSNPFCDFDGDGRKDRVMTTGATWWFASGDVMQWRYLNTHTEKVGGDLTMGYVNGDGICDITARGVVYSGGRTPLPQVSGSLPPSLPAVIR